MGYLFANDNTTPIGSMTAVPVFLDDIGVDDTTTGPTAASASDSYGNLALPCLAALSATAIQTMVWDAGAEVTFTSCRMTGKEFAQHSGIGVPCPGPTPVQSVTVTSSLYVVASDGVTQVLLQTNTSAPLPGTTTQTFTWSGSAVGRYLKRVLTISDSYPGITGNLNVTSQNTDFRVTSTTISPLPPVTPDPEPTGTPAACDILLSWNKVETATAYDLQRRQESTDWGTIFSGNALSFLDEDVIGGQAYIYQLRARNLAQTGDWSERSVENACGAEWVLEPLPEASNWQESCEPSSSSWVKS